MCRPRAPISSLKIVLMLWLAPDNQSSTERLCCGAGLLSPYCTRPRGVWRRYLIWETVVRALGVVRQGGPGSADAGRDCAAVDLLQLQTVQRLAVLQQVALNLGVTSSPQVAALSMAEIGRSIRSPCRRERAVADGIAMPSVLAAVMLIVRNLRVDRSKRTRRMNRWVLPFSTTRSTN
jgi:hypothetical protein